MDLPTPDTPPVISQSDKSGDFCKHALDDCNYPSDKPFMEQLKYLEEQNAPVSALDAFVHTYKAWKDRHDG